MIVILLSYFYGKKFFGKNLDKGKKEKKQLNINLIIVLISIFQRIL